jgi:hypothetical protein
MWMIFIHKIKMSQEFQFERNELFQQKQQKLLWALPECRNQRETKNERKRNENETKRKTKRKRNKPFLGVTSIRNGMQNGQTGEVFTEKTKKESMHGGELKICT